MNIVVTYFMYEKQIMNVIRYKLFVFNSKCTCDSFVD